MAIDQKALGAAIREVRRSRGLSQVALAKAAGLSASGNSLAMIERGERSVAIDTLNSIAEALSIPPACLTILGSTRIGESKEATELMKTLQRLIGTTVLAQSRLRAEEEAESKKQLMIEEEVGGLSNVADVVQGMRRAKPVQQKRKSQKRNRSTLHATSK